MGESTDDQNDPAKLPPSKQGDAGHSRPIDDVDPEQNVHANLDEQVISLVEEVARVEKHSVETGRVRISTHTETVEQVLNESLRSDAVSVTRVPVNRTLTEGEAAPVIRTEGSVTIVPVLEEVLVVEKRLVLREEVRLRLTTSNENVEVPVTLRRQRALTERVSPEGHVTEQQPETKTKEREP